MKGYFSDKSCCIRHGYHKVSCQTPHFSLLSGYFFWGYFLLVWLGNFFCKQLLMCSFCVHACIARKSKESTSIHIA